MTISVMIQNWWGSTHTVWAIPNKFRMDIRPTNTQADIMFISAWARLTFPESHSTLTSSSLALCVVNKKIAWIYYNMVLYLLVPLWQRPTKKKPSKTFIQNLCAVDCIHEPDGDSAFEIQDLVYRSCFKLQKYSNLLIVYRSILLTYKFPNTI